MSHARVSRETWLGRAGCRYEDIEEEIPSVRKVLTLKKKKKNNNQKIKDLPYSRASIKYSLGITGSGYLFEEETQAYRLRKDSRCAMLQNLKLGLSIFKFGQTPVWSLNEVPEKNKMKCHWVSV